MRLTVFLALIIWGSVCLAQTAGVGNYVVVRGAVKGCEHWTRRILDVEEVEDSKPISLLNIPIINVVGLEGESIQLLLESEIRKRTGNEPKSVRVQVIDAIRLPREITDQYMFSLKSLFAEKCTADPASIPVSRKRPSTPDYLEEQIQKLRQLELSRSLVWGVLYNKTLNTDTSEAGAG